MQHETAQAATAFQDLALQNVWALVFVFMLATFIGFEVIKSVSRLLHTPLMSLTNAISAIAIVGSIIIAGEQHSTLSTVLGTIAVAASMTNIVSGFLITDRMLKMFKERKPAAGGAPAGNGGKAA
jgi:NAD(P) transhydrogenase subunit alpha